MVMLVNKVDASLFVKYVRYSSANNYRHWQLSCVEPKMKRNSDFTQKHLDGL